MSSDSKGRVDEDDQHHRKRRRQHHRTDDSWPLLQGPEKLESSRKRDNSEQPDERSRRHQLSHNTSDQSLDGHSRSHWRRYQHHHRSHHRRSRNRSKDRDTTRYRGKCHRHKDRSRSPVVDPPQRHNSRRRRERSMSLSSKRNRAQPCEADASSKTGSYSQRRENVIDEPVSQESDSDPLESIIGPHPPPQPPQIQARGRGTFASTAIDSHFCSQYDPAEDFHPNSDSENDWDQALEALRDRHRWKQQGADRLRAAGFTEEEVGNWEKGGEKREEDVKWKGKGEGREWDRGKVVGADGVETKPEWGRLKGT